MPIIHGNRRGQAPAYKGKILKSHQKIQEQNTDEFQPDQLGAQQHVLN